MVDSVIDGPANDVYVVHGPYGELLVPAVSSVVLSVRVSAGEMLVHELPGLVEPDEPI